MCAAKESRGYLSARSSTITHAVRDVYLEECLRTTGQLIGRGSQFALGRETFLERKKILESQQGVHGGQGELISYHNI
jgi:hypothetical protein